MRRWSLVLPLLVLAALILPTRAALAHQLCFADKTPHCLNDPFSDYWETNGGLPVFGYPVTAAANEINADTGQRYLTQWVERNRLEDHPENAGTPYRVLLGRLGAERLTQLGRDATKEPAEPAQQPGCRYFPETGHNVCDQAQGVGFKTYWETHGLALPGVSPFGRSLQLFGLPLTASKLETNAAGDTVLTQWFERARFEWHPNNPDTFKVLLGLLGTEVRAHVGIPRLPVTPTPAPTPPAAGCPALPPSIDISVTPACLPLGDRFTITVVGRQPRSTMSVYVTQPDGSVTLFPAVVGMREPDAAGDYTLTGAFSVGTLPGVYSVTVEDRRANKVWVAYLGLTRPATPPIVDYGAMPAAINGKMDPDTGPLGTDFYMYLDSFLPEERVTMTGMRPDGSVLFGPTTAYLGTDGHPAFKYIPTGRPNDIFDQVGLYTLNVEAQVRDRQATLYFRLTP